MQIDHDEDQGQHQLIEKFIQTIKQEQLHSNLRLFDRQNFESLREQVSGQQDKLNQFLRHEDSETKLTDKNFRYMIYSAQLDKLQYLLKTYLRIRLKKIQLYCFYFMKNQQQAEKLMSVPELKFLKKYAEMRYHYFRHNVLNHFLRNYRDFKDIDSLFAKTEAEKNKEKKVYVQTNQSMIELKAPNGNEYVFAEILRNPQHLRFGIDLNASNVSSQNMEVILPGTIVFAPLKAVQERLQSQNYRLV